MRNAAWLITALGGAFAGGTHLSHQPFSFKSSTIPATTSAFVVPMQRAATGIGARSLHGNNTGKKSRGCGGPSSSSGGSSSSSSSTHATGAADAGSDACRTQPVRTRSPRRKSLAACSNERETGEASGLRRRSAKRKQAFSSAAGTTSVKRRGRSRPRAFATAVWTRGGGSSSSDGSSGDVDIVRPVVAAAVESVSGVDERQNKLIIDRVEDAIDSLWKALVVVTVPTFHLARLCFGICLLFYGMAFRTFAFHVIVFRLAGLNQLQRAVRQLGSNYREARRTIRDAASKAGTVGERVIKGDELQEAREKMIKEKQRLLADGFLSEEETRYFMRKYKAELLKIKEEQEFFQSARSSVLSVRRSVDPKQAKSSINGVYNALVTSFTASTIQSAGQLTLGLHVGSLLKTHILDLFGPVLDPIGYRLDLATYYKKEDIPYMGKANAMDGPQNLALNALCYSVVFVVFQVHPSVALKMAMVYYGARVVTDYVVMATEAVRRKLKIMTIVHTPWSAAIHAGLTVLGFIHHREILYTAGVKGLHPLAVGPGFVGLVEPLVRFAVLLSEMLSKIDFFRCTFVSDPAKAVKDIASAVKDK